MSALAEGDALEARIEGLEAQAERDNMAIDQGQAEVDAMEATIKALRAELEQERKDLGLYPPESGNVATIAGKRGNRGA